MADDWHYSGWRSRLYDRVWRRFTRITLACARAQIDLAGVHMSAARAGRPPRLLDVACGTGVLLAQVLALLPNAEVFGVDASEAMLHQARQALAAWPAMQLTQAAVGTGPTAGLPYAPGTFDLITYTNALHYAADPAATLAGLANLLAPGGQLILEDFAPHGPPPLWHAFEWLMRRSDTWLTRAYRLDEMRAAAAQAGLAISAQDTFAVDPLWHGWALRLTRAAPSEVGH